MQHRDTIKTEELYVMLFFANRMQPCDQLQNAEDYSESGIDTSIMLEEFCVFAAELARLCERGACFCQSEIPSHWVKSDESYVTGKKHPVFHYDCQGAISLTMKRTVLSLVAKGFDTWKTAVPMSASRSLNCDGKDSNRKIGSKRMAYEVFLGGSCNPTTWRSEIAIPTLQSLGITYYNPQVSQWGPELIAQEYEAKQTAKVLLFVIDNQTRNSAGVIEAAQLAATRRESLILVIYPYRLGQTILGESVSTQEYYDLMQGLLVLQYLMERQRIPIFESVSVALNCTSKVLREQINVQELHSDDGIRPIRISFGQNGVDFVTLGEIFKSIDINDSGTISLGEAWLTLQSNARCNMSVSELLNTANKSETYRTLIDGFSAKGDPAERRINFEQFCALASETSWRMKSNGVSCENWTNSFVPEPEKRDLYIGVLGKDLLWLETTAAPSIESMGLSLHRPSLNEYNIRVMPQELQKMKNSRLILLIVPQHSRGIAITALAAHLIGLRAKLVLCVQTLPEGTVVSGEKLTEQATKDYNRGRMYLSDYATREGVPVFQNIADALQHAIQLVQSPC